MTPPKRKVEVFIDILLGTSIIAQALYRITPAKLVEFKVQLHELL